MNKDRILNSKDEMYDNCENTEQLFDNFYIPLLQKYNISQNRINQLEEGVLAFRDDLCDTEKQKNKLKEKYDKALELLTEYNMPCDIDEFMDKNIDYCSMNCSVDKEIFKKCWDRFIIQKIGGKDE